MAKVKELGVGVRGGRSAGVLAAVCGSVVAAAMSVPASAQCSNTWSDQFAFSGTTASFGDAITWDDGNGPAIYVAGYTNFYAIGNLPYEYVSLAEPVTISCAMRAAKWVGDKWDYVGTPLVQELDAINAMQHARALEAFDTDGPGPMREMLVMGGRGSPYIAPHMTLMFDGTQWHRMGSGNSGEVYDLQVYNGELYASGRFSLLGGDNLAKWDVAQQDWVAVGGGVPSLGSTTTRVEQMAVGDVDADGTPELYFAGMFIVVGDELTAAKQLAYWNGTGFGTIGTFQGGVSTTTPPSMLKVVDMGDGASLLVGNVKYAGMSGPRVALAKYRAGVWSTLVGNARLGTSGPYGRPFDACMFGPAGNQKLHVAGTLLLEGLDPASTNTAIMRLRDDGSWEQLARNTQGGAQGQIHWMRPVDWDLGGPGGEKLLVGAYRNVIGGELGTLSDLVPNHLGLINGTTAEVIHSGSDDLGVSSSTFIGQLDIDGGGPEPERLFISASNGKPNGQQLRSGILSFDGTSYTQWGNGVFGEQMLVATLPGVGTGWYVIDTVDNEGAHFRKWDGSGWQSLGFAPYIGEDFPSDFQGLGAYTHNGQPCLLVAGHYVEINGQTSLWVTKWDGAAWTPMNTGLPSANPAPNLSIYLNAGPLAMEVYNNTPFLSLSYAYYDSNTSSTIVAGHEVFKFNGTAWELVPGVTSVKGFRVLDVGNGPELFAFGRMDLPEVGATYIAKWNGTSFDPFGPRVWFDNPNATAAVIVSIGAHDFGDGAEMVVALNSKAHTDSGDVVGLARLHNGAWQQVDGGQRLTYTNYIQTSTLPGTQGLFIAGAGNSSSASNAGGFDSQGIAWLKQSCAPTCPADFNTSGTVTVQDIFDFLSAWFAGTPTADFNHLGGVTVQDIFDFLGAWFAGC